MARLPGRHLEETEVDALASGPVEDRHTLSRAEWRAALVHVESCASCRRKLEDYRELISRAGRVTVSQAVAPGKNCPRDVDWDEVAAGLWPELKAQQLMMHAATCEHCGPLLRASTSVDDAPTPEEAKFLAQLAAPTRPQLTSARSEKRPVPLALARQYLLSRRILAPVLLLMLVAGAIALRQFSFAPLSGPEFAEIAADTYEQQTRGRLPLTLHTHSQSELAQWAQAKTRLAVALPQAEPALRDGRYEPVGASLVQVRTKPAVYISYQIPDGHTGLLVAPESAALSSGGLAKPFPSVTFHYHMIHAYRVVTWTTHGLTYALVSQEGPGTQQSCMVCHAAMRDRDLSRLPTPLEQ